MIDRKVKGRSRMTYADYESIRKTANIANIVSSPGLAVSRLFGGTSLRVQDYYRPRAVYIMAITEEGLLAVKEAFRGQNGSSVEDNNNATFVAEPPPGYDASYFEFDVIEGPQPKPEDRACMYLGGFVWPDRRMKPVEPVAVDQLCEPCEGTNA